MTDSERVQDVLVGAYLVARVVELEEAFAQSYAGPIANDTRKWLRSVARRIAADEARELAREQRAADRRDA